jgi:hypothetical protein
LVRSGPPLRVRVFHGVEHLHDPRWVLNPVPWLSSGSGILASIPLTAVLLVHVALMGVLWRSRKRRAPGHCKECGYDLTGNASGRCPECGTPRSS